MIGDSQITLLIIVFALIILFGILSYFVFKMDDMDIKTIWFKILKGITFTVAVVVGFVLIVMVRHNSDAVMNILQM